MEKSYSRWILLSPLEILINYVTGNGPAVKSSSKRIDDAFLQKRIKGNRTEIADGQTLFVECGCEVGGVKGCDFKVMIFG